MERMLRVCELHRERAVDTLVSRKTGTEYDLCEGCVIVLESILSGERMVLHNTGTATLPLGHEPWENKAEPNRKRPGRPPKRTQE
jgi:hypothetical protein